MILLQPVTRRFVYILLFELFAIPLSTALLMMFSGGVASDSVPVAIAVSVIALAWNFAFNSLFEAWERRSLIRERTLKVRLVHATGFEVGLFLFTIPLYMWWYAVGPWMAFKMEAAILLFFFVYTFVFTLLFDRVFVLPRA